MKFKFYLSLLALFLLFSSTKAEENSHELLLRHHQGKILIRWAPTSYKTWKTTLDSGYMVQKIKLADLLDGGNDWNNVNESPIKPLSLNEFRDVFGDEDESAALAAHMIYGANTDKGKLSMIDVIPHSLAEQKNRYTFLLIAASKSFEVAKASALAAEDNDIEEGAHYAYRLIAIGSDTIYENINLNIDNSKDYILPDVDVEELEHAADIIWQTKNYPFWGYFLEKKDNENNSWQRTTNSPLVFLEADLDSLQELDNKNRIIASEKYNSNYTPVEYRLVGIDDYGIESIGEVFSAQGVDKTPPPQADSLSAKGIDENSILVRWDWEATDEAKDMIGFRVDKAITTDFAFQEYSEILPVNARSFVDKAPHRLGNNYYRVAAIDTAGNESYSIFTYGMVYDTIPPTTPKNIQHTIDSNGVVILNWDPSPEIDVLGYRLYFANQEDHEFITLTGNPIDTNSYTDTISLKTLTKYAYYKVVALDYNYNHSDYSETIKVERPDKIRPQAPFFTSYYTDGSLIRLNWKKSYSDDADVIIIKRKEEGNNTWEEIYKKDNDADSSFIDKNVKRNLVYEYDIKAIDFSGLLSEDGRILKVKTIPLQILEDVKSLRGSYLSESNRILLSWEYEPLEDIYYVVYRSNDGENFHEIDYVEEEREYYDGIINKDQQYFYAIKPVLKKGASGKRSKSIEVIVR